jgi:hypothetical protein
MHVRILPAASKKMHADLIIVGEIKWPLRWCELSDAALGKAEEDAARRISGRVGLAADRLRQVKGHKIYLRSKGKS